MAGEPEAPSKGEPNCARPCLALRARRPFPPQTESLPKNEPARNGRWKKARNRSPSRRLGLSARNLRNDSERNVINETFFPNTLFVIALGTFVSTTPLTPFLHCHRVKTRAIVTLCQRAQRARKDKGRAK